MNGYKYECIHACMYVCFMHVRVHTHTHTHTHTQRQTDRQSLKRIFHLESPIIPTYPFTQAYSKNNSWSMIQIQQSAHLALSLQSEY